MANSYGEQSFWILPLVPEQFKREHDYGDEYPVAHCDQGKVALREADRDETGVAGAHRFLRIQLILIAILEPVLAQFQCPANGHS